MLPPPPAPPPCHSEPQPIIGALRGVARPGTPEGKEPFIDWRSLYAQDEQGYDNLCARVSASHLDRPIHEPAHVTMDALASRTNGLIALTAARDGALAQLLADRKRKRLNSSH